MESSLALADGAQPANRQGIHRDGRGGVRRAAVVGQLVASDNGYKIIAGSFSAATEQPISNYTAVLVTANAIPKQPDIKQLLAAAPAPATPAAQAKLLLVPYELARAPQLCAEQTAATGANAVPHASLRLSLLNCSGAIVGRATAQGNFKPAMLFFRDPDQAVIDAASDAEDAAITQLFPR